MRCEVQGLATSQVRPETESGIKSDILSKYNKHLLRMRLRVFGRIGLLNQTNQNLGALRQELRVGILGLFHWQGSAEKAGFVGGCQLAEESLSGSMRLPGSPSMPE